MSTATAVDENGPSYWLDLFTAKSWQEFHRAGATTSGFTAHRWTTVQKMQIGDYLLCYLTGISRFIGVLEVTAPGFEDNARIWSDATFPSRVKVKIVHALEPETAVPVLDLRDELTVFQDLANPNYWSGAFRGSPALWKPEDGRAVVEAVAKAVLNPTKRPFDKAKLAHRPRTFHTSSGDDVTVPGEESFGDETPGEIETGTDTEASEHTDIQGLLLTLGSAMGLKVWVARNDRHRSWHGQSFSDQFKLLSELPHNFDLATGKIIEMIDVLWLDGNAIRAAFEIESTTSIYSGLLRMSDLVAMQPNLQIPLFLVAPDERRPKVIAEVNRATFASLKQPLMKVCRFISFSVLRSQLEQAGPLVRYLKPEILQEWSEACEAEGSFD